VARGSRFLSLLRTTDHKTIGLMYLDASFAWFVIGGLMAMLMRGELARPGLQFLSPEQYNQLVTMHGTVMLLFFATPLFFAFGNLIMPLQIGAPDVAFPRLNAFSYWLFPLRLHDRGVGLPHPRRCRRLRVVRLHAAVPRTHSPGAGADLWIAGLAVSGLGTILGAVTSSPRSPASGAGHDAVPDADLHLEHAGHQPARDPGVPDPHRRALRLLADRNLGALVYSDENGGPMLWQHLFWFFGHPEVYIIALPFFGIITEVIPVFSRKPLFGYKGMVGATLASASCRWRSGRTTCTPPAPCCCRSSPS
jgi:cytochrome c oxidase subunit 1